MKKGTIENLGIAFGFISLLVVPLCVISYAIEDDITFKNDILAIAFGVVGAISLICLVYITLFMYKNRFISDNHVQIKQLLTTDEKYLLADAIYNRKKQLANAGANMGQTRRDALEDIELLDRFYDDCIHES